MKVNFSLKFLLIYRGFFISIQLFLLHYHLIILTPFLNVGYKVFFVRDSPI